LKHTFVPYITDIYKEKIMAIPSYQSLMLPLLQLLGDQKEHSLRDTIIALAKQLNLSEEEREALLPSGSQRIFDNRVSWARTYMKKAGLIQSPERGLIVISNRGMEVLKNSPQEIDVNFLNQFDEFKQFRLLRRARVDDGLESPESTPEEALESAYQRLHDDLSVELIQQLKSCSPSHFERIVVELLVKMGYGGSLYDAGRAIGKSGDEGIDGIIKEDRLGLDIIYIQAKRWENTVGRPEVQKFAGALQGHRARKGILITTSSFSKDAHEYVSKIESKIILIDGELLSQLMIDYDLGVTSISTYKIKRVDSDYFADE